MANDSDRQRYFLKPQVWQDIQTAFDVFFKIEPGAYGYRHNYARYAAWCGQWKVFQEQARMFPSTNYSYFGGREQFERMVKAAEENVQGNASTNSANDKK